MKQFLARLPKLGRAKYVGLSLVMLAQILSGTLVIKPAPAAAAPLQAISEVKDAAPLTAIPNVGIITLSIVAAELADSNGVYLPSGSRITRAQMMRDILGVNTSGHALGTASTASFYKEQSYQKTTIIGAVADPVLIPKSTMISQDACTSDGSAGSVGGLATDLNGIANNIDKSVSDPITPYTIKVYVVDNLNITNPSHFKHCGFSGVHFARGSSSAIIINRLAGGDLINTMSHELGHAMGLAHAHSACTVSSDGTVHDSDKDYCEYGDSEDVMGGGTMGVSMHFNASAKQKLGWLSGGQIGTMSTSTSTARYTLTQLEKPSGSIHSLRIPINRTVNGLAQDLFVEFRQNYASYYAGDGKYHAYYDVLGGTNSAGLYIHQGPRNLADPATQSTFLLRSVTQQNTSYVDPEQICITLTSKPNPDDTSQSVPTTASVTVQRNCDQNPSVYATGDIAGEDVIGQVDANGNPVFDRGQQNNGSPLSGTSLDRNGFTAPRSICVDTIAHRLFASDYGESRILEYNLDTANKLTDHNADHVMGVADFATWPYYLTLGNVGFWPLHLACDSVHHRLFVSDYHTHDNNEGGPHYGRVMIFDVSTVTDGMSASWVIGQPGFDISQEVPAHPSDNNQNAQVFAPNDIAYDDVHNRLFVVDNQRILIFDTANITNYEPAINVLNQPDFSHQNTYCWSGSQSSGCASPDGIAYDGKNDRLFVVLAYGSGACYVQQSQCARARFEVFDTSSITNGEAATLKFDYTNFIDQNIYGSIVYDSLQDRLFSTADYSYNLNNVPVLGVADVRPSTLNTTTTLTPIPDVSSQSASIGPLTLGPTVIGPGFYDPTSRRLYVTDTDNNRYMIYTLATTNYSDWKITSPSSGSNLQGAVTFKTTLPVGLAVNTDIVEYYSSDNPDVPFGQGIASVNNGNLDYNTLNKRNGTYQIWAQLTTAQGYFFRTPSITVVINNPAPSISVVTGIANGDAFKPNMPKWVLISLGSVPNINSVVAIVDGNTSSPLSVSVPFTQGSGQVLYTWDVTRLNAGSHTVKFTLSYNYPSDSTGALSSTSTPVINFTVLTGPSVWIVSPTAGIINNTVYMNINVNSYTYAKSVEYYLDQNATPFGSAVINPIAGGLYVWDTRTLGIPMWADHTVIAKIFDANHNLLAISMPIKITVLNLS